MSRRQFLLLSVSFLALLSTGRLRAQEPAEAPAPTEISTARVEVDGELLFTVRGVSTVSADERARFIRERIIAVATDPSIGVESLRVVDSQRVSRIIAGETPIMSVLTADADLEQVETTDLANAFALRIGQAITAYRAARSAAALRRAALMVLGATLAVAVAILLLRQLWRRVDQFLVRRLQSRIQTVGIQSFEVVRAERIRELLRAGIVAFRAVVLLALILVYVGFVLAQLPWTRGLSRDIESFALAPLNVIGSGILVNIPSLVFLAVLFLTVRLSLKLIHLFFDAVGRGEVRLGGFDRDWAQPTYNLVRVAMVAFALIVGYPYIPGSESEAFKGISLFIGILFSIGSSSAISNIVAGYMITYRRAFRVGDLIRVGGAFGEVVDTRLQVTHLRSIKNEEIVIPNSQILVTEVCNYSSLSKSDGLILHTDVGIGYETPWRQVEAILLTAAERTAGLSREPRPFVLEKQLGGFAVTYELNAYCHDPLSFVELYAALHRNILDAFNEYGVQIMTPSYEGDPDKPKVVAEKDWYAAPAGKLPTAAT